MEITSLISLVVRVLLILFAAVIVGVSVVLNRNNDDEVARCVFYNNCNDGDGLNGYLRPMVAAFRYCIFVGAFGLIDAFVGIAAAFASALWLVAVVVDALAAIFYVAGGARLAAFLAKPYACEFVNSFPGLEDQCTKIKADSAFLFLGFIGAIVALVLGFFAGRRGGSGGAFV